MVLRRFLFLKVFVFLITFHLSLTNVYAQTLDQLRDQFKAEENRIVKHYDKLANQPDVDKTQVNDLMKKALVENRKNFSATAGKDPRYSQSEVEEAFKSKKLGEIAPNKTGPGYIDEVNNVLAEKGLKLKSTGGSPELTPSHINADIDTVIVRANGSPATAAEQLEGIKLLEKHSLKQGDVVRQNAARFDNKGKDLTTWKPETADGQQAKLTDHDAFKTEGGKHSTRNPGALQDAHGEFLDNQSKFESARVEGDLKTQGKSLLKAGTGEASGVKTVFKDPKTGRLKVVRDSNFQKRNPELYKKAKALKDYGTTHEAGITEVGDSPQVQQQKIENFQKEMSTEMDALEKEATRKGKIRDTVRENFQDSYDNAGMTDDAKQIQNERNRVKTSNQQAQDAIVQDKARATSKDTYTGGRKGPGDRGHGQALPVADAPDTSISGRAKNALARLNELEARAVGASELPANASARRVKFNAGAEKAMGAMAVAGVAYEAGTLGHKLSKARILYEAAANEKDDAMAKSYLEQAEQLENDAVTQVEMGVGLGAATMVSPVFVGGILVGAGAYQGTRAVMENTETGRAIEAGLRERLANAMETIRDTATVAAGGQTYDEIAFSNLTERQSTWIEALRKGTAELEEGATVNDVLTLVERNPDKIASLQNPGYLSGIIRAKKTPEQIAEEKRKAEEEAKARLQQLLAQLEPLKNSMDALDAQAQALNGELSALESTFIGETKALTKELERASKDLMNLARDVTSLESLANKMDSQNAEAARAADSAYSAGEQCAAARGQAENFTLRTCELAQSIQGTDNIQELDNLLAQLQGEKSNALSQSEIYRQQLSTARMASRQAEDILRSLNTLRTEREEGRTTLAQKENLIPVLQSQMVALESQLGALQGKASQWPGITGQAAGILSQAQALETEDFPKEGKKIIKEIQGTFARISKSAGSGEKISEKNQDKLNTPKDKLKNIGDELAQAKTRMEALLNVQISAQAISQIQKSADEAKASYEAAQIFDDAVREAVRNADTCAGEGQRAHAQKTSPEAQVARHNCSQWPGTAAQWNSGKKAPECACTAGNLWDEGLFNCVTEEQYYVSRTDCTGYGPAAARWDPGRGQALCYCSDGYEFNNSMTACRPSAQSQVAQANCSAYPGTVPRWDGGSEQVRCDCPGGYNWDGYQCVYQQQPQQPPFDPGQLVNTMQQIANTMNNGSGAENTGGTWNNTTSGGGTQPQGDSCSSNYSFSGYGINCGCSGYTWNASQGKCVPGGGGSPNSGQNTAGFQGFGNQNTTTTTNPTTNTNTGGSASGGVDTGPGRGYYPGGINTGPGGKTPAGDPCTLLGQDVC